MQEIKIAVEEKRKAYKKILQRYVPEEVREQRKREYRDSLALINPFNTVTPTSASHEAPVVYTVTPTLAS